MQYDPYLKHGLPRQYGHMCEHWLHIYFLFLAREWQGWTEIQNYQEKKIGKGQARRRRAWQREQTWIFNWSFIACKKKKKCSKLWICEIGYIRGIDWANICSVYKTTLFIVLFSLFFSSYLCFLSHRLTWTCSWFIQHFDCQRFKTFSKRMYNTYACGHTCICTVFDKYRNTHAAQRTICFKRQMAVLAAHRRQSTAWILCLYATRGDGSTKDEARIGSRFSWGKPFSFIFDTVVPAIFYFLFFFYITISATQNIHACTPTHSHNTCVLHHKHIWIQAKRYVRRDYRWC